MELHREEVVAVVLLTEALADVFVGAQDGLMSPIARGCLEEGISQPLPSGDVLLIIRYIVSEPRPPVFVGLLRLVEVCSQDLEGASGDPPMAGNRVHLLQAAPQEH